MAIIGTCGNCGGPVEVPDAWWGTQPPTPRCSSCGSTPRNAFGKTIPMNPVPERSLVDLRRIWTMEVSDDAVTPENLSRLKDSFERHVV